jgi:hypothetical protein
MESDRSWSEAAREEKLHLCDSPSPLTPHPIGIPNAGPQHFSRALLDQARAPVFSLVMSISLFRVKSLMTHAVYGPRNQRHSFIHGKLFLHTIVMANVAVARFAYTTGGDLDLQHMQKIGTGGFGDVHKVPPCPNLLTVA